MVNVISIPSLLIYVIALPSFFAFKLRQGRSIIVNGEKDHETAEVQQFRSRWGFLVQGIRSEYYYWEVLTMIRKTLILFAVEFMTSVSDEVQVLVSILVCIVGVLIVVRFRPMTTETANRMNVFDQLAQMLLMYNGLFYITGYGKWYMVSGLDFFFVPAIFVPSLGFLLAWLRLLWIQVLCWAYLRSRALFKTLTLGALDADAFYKRHLMEKGLEPSSPRENRYRVEDEDKEPASGEPDLRGQQEQGDDFLTVPYNLDQPEPTRGVRDTRAWAQQDAQVSPRQMASHNEGQRGALPPGEDNLYEVSHRIGARHLPPDDTEEDAARRQLRDLIEQQVAQHFGKGQGGEVEL
jgi:hypothetical protein